MWTVTFVSATSLQFFIHVIEFGTRPVNRARQIILRHTMVVHRTNAQPGYFHVKLDRVWEYQHHFRNDHLLRGFCVAVIFLSLSSHIMYGYGCGGAASHKHAMMKANMAHHTAVQEHALASATSHYHTCPPPCIPSPCIPPPCSAGLPSTVVVHHVAPTPQLDYPTGTIAPPPAQPPPAYPAAPSTYPAAPTGYPAAPTGYPAAPTGYPAAPTGYPAATTGYPSAPTGYPAATTGYPAAPTGYPAATTGYPAAPTGYPAPPSYPGQPAYPAASASPYSAPTAYRNPYQ
ncbi:postacrosomal sheath WW domain-binding protein-like isoform X2 [Acanthaster planci]|uniref:Postacrosomal sheath WW domain-binding protein-like isoform X2 n=1 Tax=Acanthaster planci TaxID=133434 RepID=A0A8B7XVJ5_ACAPL|nr:postacrosomal sheath WW domain-binding protein-like isoform X2 [Acanthaster planci]